MLNVQEFGIELQSGSDKNAAKRLLNNDYTKNTAGDRRRIADIANLSRTGEGWAQMYVVRGFISEEEKKLLISNLKMACNYFLADPSRCERQEKAMQKAFPDRHVNDTFNNLPFVRIQQVADLDSRHEFIQRDYLVKKEAQSQYTRAHSHTEVDVAASLTNISAGVQKAEHRLLS